MSSESSKIKERRQRARDAFEREYGGIIQDIEAAIETATRVKIDDEIVRIHRKAWLDAYNERLMSRVEHDNARCPLHFTVVDVAHDALVATMTELGFEVEAQ